MSAENSFENASDEGAACKVPRARASGSSSWWLVGGSVLSAILASACCVGPLILALLGLGGAATLIKLSPLRPYLVPVTLVLLAAGLTLAYRRPRAGPLSETSVPAAECGCARPRTRAAGRVALWVLAAAIVVLLVSPYVVPALLG
jgi:mercuric ion transport protein